MEHQPDDVPVYDYNDNEFNNIEGQLTLFTYSQADNSIFDFIPYNGLPSPPTESLALNNLNKFLNEDFNLIETSSFDSFQFNEQLFSEFDLEALAVDPFEGPIDEVTITTTTSDVEHDSNYDIVTNTPSDINLTPDAVEATTEKVPDQINLASVDSSIQKQLLSVIVQPTIDPRRRYKKEGKRRIKKLLSKPTTLDLSKLKNYKLNSNQLLWLRLTLITGNDGPLVNVSIHPDILTYYSNKAQKQIDGSVCIPIPQSDIDKGKIELKDLSIIKRLDKNYTFKLIPYRLSTIDNKSEIYVIDEKKTTSGNAKIFREKYNLKASRIACQILIEENGSRCFTEIACVTNVMNEQKYQPKATKSTKRLVKNKQKSGKKRRNATKPKSAKRKKRFNC